jgi:hypothetical protein
LEAEQQREYSEQSLFDLPGIASYDSPLANASYRTTGSSLRTPTVSSRPRNATPPATSLLIQHSDPTAAHRSVVAQQAALEDQELRRAIQVIAQSCWMILCIIRIRQKTRVMLLVDFFSSFQIEAFEVFHTAR